MTPSVALIFRLGEADNECRDKDGNGGYDINIGDDDDEFIMMSK